MKTVYVVKTEDMQKNELGALFHNIETRGFFAERAAMELRPDFQQIIPSFILVDKEAETMLLYQRKPKHTEQRLAGMHTPVFGGHIDPIDWDKEDIKAKIAIQDFDIPSVIYNGLAREMKEETGLDLYELLDSAEFYGIIKDDSNDVGKVHTGLVYCIDIKLDEELLHQIVSKSEVNSVKVVDLESFSELLASTSFTLESWAQLVIEDIIKAGSF